MENPWYGVFTGLCGRRRSGDAEVLVCFLHYPSRPYPFARRTLQLSPTRESAIAETSTLTIYSGYILYLPQPLLTPDSDLLRLATNLRFHLMGSRARDTIN